MRKLLTPAIVAGASLFIAAVPPDAVAPEVPALLVCAPSETHDRSNSDSKSLDASQQALARHLSKRFFIAAAATERMVAAANRAAAEVGLDPLLVLAVISIESTLCCADSMRRSTRSRICSWPNRCISSYAATRREHPHRSTRWRGACVRLIPRSSRRHAAVPPSRTASLSCWAGRRRHFRNGLAFR